MTVQLRPITTVLVANRGEVVSRVARTASRLGMHTIGVYTETDIDAAYLADVDAAVALGDDSASSPYLDPGAIIAAARVAGADAIHPGYGFLAENADFAQACEAAGLLWIGPTPASMRAMSGKIRGKEIAREAGVPVLDSVRIEDDLWEVRELAERVGLPLLVKPSAGGGGKGMHRIDDLADLEAVVASARRAARSSFGDGTLFVERYVERTRHVEVQVFGDKLGSVVTLGDRDCSIQRRHQKIVEEAPAPALPDEVHELLASSAAALARRIGYCGAGTVEFLVFDDQVAFLEMNTRLQVEHPVTEQVTGLDLVEWQLRVAAREPLPLTQDQIRLTGHSIEVRLYAEDPAHGYLPSPGTVRLLEIPASPQARWELGVRTGSSVNSRYDPLIAKIIATGDTRDEAAGTLVTALGRMRIHGVATNRGLLIAIAAHDEFRAARLSTAFLEEHPELLAPVLPAGSRVVHAVAAALHTALDIQAAKTVQRFAPYGWRNLPSQDEQVTVHAGDEAVRVNFHHERDGTWFLDVDGETHRARVFQHTGELIDLELSGVRHRARVATYPDQLVVDTAYGESRFVERSALQESEDVGSAEACLATVPGAVVEVSVTEGQQVAEGDTLVVLEAMKMEHRLTASGAGRVTRVLVAAGDSVDYQQLLVDVVPRG